jgi:ferredoxin
VRITVDRSRCAGQAMCEAIAADVFEVNDDDVVALKVTAVPDDRLADVEHAVLCCPNEALRLVP